MASFKRFSILLAFLITACDSGSGVSDPAVGQVPPGGCNGSCVDSQKNGNPDNVRLTINDVKTMVAQGVAEADARAVDATVAVVDRVGNVLAVWRTGSGAPREVLIASSPDGMGGSKITGGLEGIKAGVDGLAAIAKAITGAYLSSEGNAFSTRTASQIVQEHFNPGESFQPGGPLFGVQFSQLACSDFSQRFTGAPSIGPQRSPLGLSADPGGFPLYKNGTVVGGVGVIADDIYSLDPNVLDNDRSNQNANMDELIALAASYGYSAPVNRRANRITIEGKTLRFSDAKTDELLSAPQNAPAYPPANGQLVAVIGYTPATPAIQPGLVFGSTASGVRAADSGNGSEAAYANDDGFVFVDGGNNNRYPATAGAQPAGSQLSSNEVEVLLQESLRLANQSRAQVRRPHSSQARVTVSVVDTDGNILGMLRSRDAPVFGSDVSLQKARTAAFFSSSDAASTLGTSNIDARYISLNGMGGIDTVDLIDLGDYVTAVQGFLGEPTALSDGALAFSDRAGGNLSRPFFPDGIDNAGPGPFSKPSSEWSPFSTGLQLDLVNNGIIQHVLFAAGTPGISDAPQSCGGITHATAGTFSTAGFSHKRLANGIQIFPGSAPIYRNDELVGGIGVSGDGVEQDDLIAFLAVDRAGGRLSTINNAPDHMRADTLRPKGTRLRYIQCPQAPFLGSDEQQPCKGK